MTHTHTSTDVPRTRAKVKPIVPDPKKLNAHPATRARLENIEDPLERLIEASRIADQCYHKTTTMADLRQRRRVAVVALFRHHKENKAGIRMTKAEIARLIGARDRRVVDACFKYMDLRDVEVFRSRFINKKTREMNEDLAFEETLAEARRTHEECTEREAMGATAREVRRVLIYELTETDKYGRRHKPTQLAELTGRTTALIAQNRTGSSNRTKPEYRAAIRKRRKEQAAAAA